MRIRVETSGGAAGLIADADLSDADLADASEVMGRAVATELRDHFSRRDQTPNRLGGRRTNFWAQLAMVTGLSSHDSRQATVTVADNRFAQKVHGGTIRPRAARALTIPIHPAAHGRRASELEEEVGDLFIVETNGNAFLAGRPDGFDGAVFFYVLKKSVTQEADPEALPSDEEVLETMAEALGLYLDRRNAA